MLLQEELINDIKLLPEHMLRAVSVMVKEALTLASEPEQKLRPVYGSGKGKMWIADDFDEPLEELREYME